MSTLTIALIEGDPKVFRKRNKGLFSLAGDSQELEILLPQEEADPYGRFRKALEEIRAPWVLFANDATVISKGAAEKILRGLEGREADIVTLQVGEWRKKRRYGFLLDSGCPCYFPGHIFRRECLAGGEMPEEEIPFFRDAVLIRMAGREKTAFLDVRIDSAEEKYLEKRPGVYQEAFCREWYIPRMENLLLPVLRQGTTQRQQKLILYMIWLMYWCNWSFHPKNLLDAGEVEKLEELTGQAADLMDEDIFFDEETTGSVAFNRSMFLYQKRTKQEKVIRSYGKWVTVKIYAINIAGDELTVDFAPLNDMFGLTERGMLALEADGEAIPLRDTGVSNTFGFFGKTASEESVYQAAVPLRGKQAVRIRFVLRTDWEETVVKPDFRKAAARLTAQSEHSWCRLGPWLLRYADKTISVSRTGKAGDALREARFQKDIFRLRRSRKAALSTIGYRDLHFAGNLGKGRPVWIFFDKLYKGGDNGEYLFDYVFRNVPEVMPCYIVAADSPDYPRLTAKYGKNILAFDSRRQKLMVMKADLIFFTHAKAYKYCGFEKQMEVCMRGELKAGLVCIQHGLTMQDIPQYQNRMVDNTLAYFCASPREIENLRQPIYGYGEGVLHLTGLPRFDGLVSDDRKQILIAPTWRRDVVTLGNKTGSAKEYNARFKDSVYFHVYHDLINDPKLNEWAERYGYKIVFLVHPTVGAQCRDFTAPDTVDVVNGAEVQYEPYLTQSSLMVTDYSGVQYDFAYMRKPVIYYHPEELPPQYGSGHFSYEEDGFGPIVTGRAELVERICAAMEQGCPMGGEYEERVDAFFPYKDHDNCRRICDTIKEVFYPEGYGRFSLRG